MSAFKSVRLANHDCLKILGLVREARQFDQKPEGKKWQSIDKNLEVI